MNSKTVFIFEKVYFLRFTHKIVFKLIFNFPQLKIVFLYSHQPMLLLFHFLMTMIIVVVLVLTMKSKIVFQLMNIKMIVIHYCYFLLIMKTNKILVISAVMILKKLQIKILNLLKYRTS